MEASIIVDGFKKSMDMYNVKYSKMIGDGDSNVYKQILDSRPYDDLTVQKVECKNHLLRNMCNKLKDLTRASKYGNINLRKKIGSSILRIRSGVNSAIRFRKNSTESPEEKIKNLRKDIMNAPYHVFGEHENCDKYFCTETGNSMSSVTLLKESGLFYNIMAILQNLSDNARSLLFDATNNVAESYNSVIAKFIGGKRINFCKSNSYKTRCNAAALSFNTPLPTSKLHHVMYKCSPGRNLKAFQQRRIATRKATQKHRNKCSRKRLFSSTTKKDDSYGEHAVKPDLNIIEFMEKKEIFLKSLVLTDEECKKIEESTKLQRDSQIWLHERSKRLTASFFGQICNKLPHTGCHNIVRDILYRNIDTVGMQYGRLHEQDALMHLKEHLNIKVQSCGLFINTELPYLGATPDGLIDEDGLVEIKCPSSCAEMTPEDCIKAKKFSFFIFKPDTKSIEINKKHKYYYQVQGQMRISDRKFCLFVLWTPLGVYVHKILRDEDFWDKYMESKLRKFYYDCLLPEIIDPRYTRGMPIRNPQYILDEQVKREALKNKNKEKLK